MDIDRKLIDRLQAVPWFQEITPEHFEAIAKFTRSIDIAKDEIIFSEGDHEKYIYVVIEGRVAIEVNSPDRGRLRIFTAEALDVVGWSSVTPVVRQRTATARAVVDSHLLSIDAMKLQKLCDENCDLGYVIMRRIANVIAVRLMGARMQLLDFYGKSDSEE
jgi:CRP/FNR family cyclic AMP-dependent transcriptional regulator